jgi:hypothetical protein
MRRFHIFILVLFFTCKMAAQDNNLSFQFHHILFKDFADTIERTIPVKIYYSNKWVDSLYLDINAKGDSLSGIFNKSMTNIGFSFIITENNKLILSKGYSIKTDFNKEYQAHLRQIVTKPDTNYYFQPDKDKEQAAINEEYKIFRIGNPSALKKSSTAFLSGTLKEYPTEEPVIGAMIYIEKLKAGVVTNNAGYYSIELPKGQYQVEYRMVGMKPAKRNIIVYSDGVLNVEMLQNTSQLDEVNVSGQKENNIRNIKMGAERISIKMLKQIPMGMGEVDLIKSSIMLPGVQSAGEASGGYNIRGGSTDQNLILFDGAPVINPSHFFGFFSAFNSDIIDEVTLYKSSIPAKYGGRISSVMDISLREGNYEKFNVSGGISPFTGRLMMEGPLVKKVSSLIMSCRTTYSDWILGLLNSEQLRKSRANFNDFQGLYTFKINPRNSFSLSGYLSNDGFNYYEEEAIRYSNLSSAARWKHTFNQKLSSQVSAIISNYSYQLDSKQDSLLYNSLTYKLNQVILKTDFLYFPSEKHKVEFGLDATKYSLSPGVQKPLGDFSEIDPKSLTKENALENSLYISDEFEYSPRLLFSGGIRLTLFTSLGPGVRYVYSPDHQRSVEYLTDTVFFKNGSIMQSYPGIEFRFSSRFEITSDFSLKAGVQRNFQYLNMISNTTSMSPTDIWKLSDSYLKPQRGDQFSLGLYKNFNRKAIETSVEAYYKILNNILDYKGGAVLLMNEHLETDILEGKGKAYGIEMMMKKQIGKLTGWVSYTYSRSLLKFDGKFEEEKINGGKYFPANFDKPNDFKFVANVKLSRRINFTTNFMYNTGRPVTYPATYFYFHNVIRLYYSERNEFRIPDYMRLDLSATVNGNLKAKKINHSSLTFTVYNVLGRKNPYSIFFKIEDGTINGYKMSIFGQPVFMLTYNFHIRGNATTDF